MSLLLEGLGPLWNKNAGYLSIFLECWVLREMLLEEGHSGDVPEQEGNDQRREEVEVA